MKENIDLAKQHFPDWEVRIHYNSTVPQKYIDEYKELGANCILCKNLGINKMNWEGMFWRWLPMDDDDVDIWISRDADSRLSEREANLIGEWIKSDKIYDQLIKNNPNDALAYNNYAYSLVERNKDLQRALSYAKKAVKLEPENPSYLDTIAWAYYKMNDIKI